MSETIVLTLTPTPTMRRINGEPAREWRGYDDQGVEVVAYIRNVSPQTDDDGVNAKYARVLQELGAAEAQPIAIDVRNVL